MIHPILLFTGEELRDLRDGYGYSQAELAERLDLSRSQVANIEAGRKDLGRLRTYLLRHAQTRALLLAGRPKLGGLTTHV